MSNAILQSEDAATVAQIIAKRNEALDKNHSEINRLSARVTELNNIGMSRNLSQSEQKERDGLLESIDELVAVETQVLLFSISALDSSAEAKLLASQIEGAIKELTEVKKKVESISQTIKNAGNFLNSLAGVLNGLTGLLKVLA